MTPVQRHLCMSHIRSADTNPERLVRQWLWSHGYRYRLNVKSVPGKPDIVLRRYRTAIFVNGCFWHGHDGCDKYRIPKSNTGFWLAKITRNRVRDKKNYDVLQANGWHVIVVWECELASQKIENTMRGVALRLDENLLSIYRYPTPFPYGTEENESAMPIAAEENNDWKRNE